MNAIKQENVDAVDVLFNVSVGILNNKEQLREIDSVLLDKYNIQQGTLNELLVNIEKFNTLSEEEQVAIIKSIYEVTKNEEINPQLFYSKKAITIASKFEKEDESISFPYTIENVLRSSKTDFVTVMSYRQLVDWLNNDMITYNYDCQRLPIEKVNKKGKISVKPKTVLKSVKSIADKMVKGEFSTDTIILNILVNGNDKIDYSNGDLTIFEGTEVDIIDGWHRLQAMLLALEIDPELEGYMNVSVKNYTLKRAQEALGQFNTVNPFDKVLAKHYNEKGSNRNITKKLMDNSELKGKVSIKVRVDKKLGQLTNTDVLSKSIGKLFNIENDLEEEKTYEALKRFFGILINSYPKEFKTDMLETLKNSWINHHNTFVGYIVIAKKLIDKFGYDFPIDEVTRVVNAIDMSKDENEYNSIMKEQGNRNSDQTKELIRKFFEKKVDELLA